MGKLLLLTLDEQEEKVIDKRGCKKFCVYG